MKRTNIHSIVVAILAIAFAACSPSGGDDPGDGSRGAFVSTWKTDNPGSSESNQITLPLVEGGVYDCMVDWGDGTTSGITSYDDADKTHTYATVGTYTVSITGMIQGFSFGMQPRSAQYGDSAKFMRLRKWGILRLGNTGKCFQGCLNMSVEADDIPDLSGISNFSYMFTDCRSMTTIPRVSKWDVSLVTDMRFMFLRCAKFNSDIGPWDMSNVTDIINMLQDADSFNQNISSWKLPKVKFLSMVFSGCDAFNQDLSSWDVSKVVDMSGLFSFTGAFNQDLGSWDVSSVRSMNCMFSNAFAFNQDISGWNVSNVTNMNSIFYNARSFNQNLRFWDVSSVELLDGAFSYSGMSSANYRDFLIGISGLPVLKRDVAFGAVGITYSSAAADAARRKLITDYNWTITDGN